MREHLARAMSVLGPRTPLVVLQDVRTASARGDARGGDRSAHDLDTGDVALEPCAPGTGDLPWDALMALVRDHVPPHVPVLAE